MKNADEIMNFERSFMDACETTVKVATTGYCGGDGGHGGRTTIELHQMGGYMEVATDNGPLLLTDSVYIVVKGDAELCNLIKCLKEAHRVLTQALEDEKRI